MALFYPQYFMALIRIFPAEVFGTTGSQDSCGAAHSERSRGAHGSAVHATAASDWLRLAVSNQRQGQGDL